MPVVQCRGSAARKRTLVHRSSQRELTPGFTGVTSDFTARWPVPTGGYHKNVVRITRAGAYLWNEVDLKSVNDGGERILGLHLTAIGDLPDQPFTVSSFEPGAPCATIYSVRRLIVEHLGCSTAGRCFQARVAQR